MSKTLCELGKKKMKKHMDKHGKYLCAECEQTVNKKKKVCKPVKI